MAGETEKRIDREAGNARDVVAPALYILCILAFGLFAVMVYHFDSSMPWRLAVVAIGAIVFYWVFERSNLIQSLSGRAAKNGIVWAAISVVLGAAGWTRRAFTWIFAPLFRLLARLARPLARPALALLAPLALPLAIVLTAALTYRLAVFPALIARGSGASGLDLFVLAGDWLLFGLSYGLVGAAAPLATLLLLLRRRGSSLGIAALLQGVALVGTSLAYLLASTRAGIRLYWSSDADSMALFHPLFAAPKVGIWPISAAETLGGFLAIFLLTRPRVRRHYRFPDSAGAGAAVIAFGLVVVQSKVLWVRHSIAWALSDRAAKNDATGAAISKVLGAVGRTRAVFARLLAIPPVRRLARLALLLTFVLAAAVVGWPQPQP